MSRTKLKKRSSVSGFANRAQRKEEINATKTQLANMEARIDWSLIARKKQDPRAWAAFVQRGNALLEAVRLLQTIDRG
ncbi:MAG: hypothetical protein HQL69_02625 [Magnetococcales bacterium]|nr:hypothetical protein [Magnetococcales bacterium]